MLFLTSFIKWRETDNFLQSALNIHLEFTYILYLCLSLLVKTMHVASNNATPSTQTTKQSVYLACPLRPVEPFLYNS